MTPKTTQKLSGTPQAITPGLYLIATPIGNMRDITLRALDVLEQADAVYCEDSRVTGKLLQAYGLKKKLRVYNDHSTQADRERILAAIAGGAALALVSDAGTPLVSDPGYKLVRGCLDAGVSVTALPGANAAITGLQLSGLPPDSFIFQGFLPAKRAARKERLAQWSAAPATSVFFESANRVADTLSDILGVWGDCECALTRELTKKFEEVIRGRISEVLDRLAQKPVKGEIVLVVAAPQKKEGTEQELETLLKAALKTHSLKDAAALVAGQTGLPKKAVYEAALALKS